jgi:hypothetical protein
MLQLSTVADFNEGLMALDGIGIDLTVSVVERSERPVLSHSTFPRQTLITSL